MKLLHKILSPVKHFFSLSAFFPAVLVLIWFIITVNNYIPGTILSGWDTLHPEFNFSLNFERLIFGTWREEQGLGAVAAHSHMADLPRVILLWISSFILPMEFLRFFLIAGCLLVGILGVYFFIKRIILDFLKEQFAKVFAFLGSLFYLFNLGTVQHFYVPFEMFNVQYALLPWIFLSVCNYLKSPSKKGLLTIGLLNLLAAPMAYAPLLWYVYFGSLGLFLLPFLKGNIKNILAIISVTIVVNSFWILPNLYFLVSGNAALVPEAKINKLFSEEAYLQNASFGNLENVLIFKNFLFNWPVYTGFDRFDYLLSIWRVYISTPVITWIGYAAAFIALFGVLGSLHQKQKYAKALLLPLIFSLIFMLGSTFPISLFTDFLRDHISLLKEALRFPFTKFSIVLMFAFSVFFALGNYYLFNFLSKLKFLRSHILSLNIIQAFIISVALMVYCLPMFQGQLISRLMQVQIPSEYFQMFDYLNTQQKDGRVLVFPVHSLWGWVYYDWGFQGAQFITFGIKQPVLDRDWDRWNPKNEEMYRQLSYAAYADNDLLFENLLHKYQITYLVIDENIIAAGSEKDKRSLNLAQNKLMLERIPGLKPVQKFEGITVYEYDKEFNSVRIGSNLEVEQKAHYSEDIDVEYHTTGDYITEVSNTKNLISNNLNFLDSSTVKETSNETTIQLSQNPGSLSNLLSAETILPVGVYARVNEDQIELSLVPVYGNINPESGMKLNYSYNGSQKMLFNFDSYQTLEYELPSNDFRFLGTATINTKQFNNISAYDLSGVVNTTIPNQSIKQEILTADAVKIGTASEFELNLCTKPGENQVFAASDVENGALSIAAKNSKACAWIPMDKVVNKDTTSAVNGGAFKSLVGFSFAVNSQSNALGRFCLYDLSRGRCVLEKKYLLSQENNTIYFLADSNTVDRLQIVLYLEGTEKDVLQEIHYSNLSYFQLLPKEIQSFSSEELNSYLSTLSFGKELQFSISKTISDNFSVNILEPGHNDNECSSLKARIAERVVEDNLVTYRSKGGSSCDYYSLPNVSHATGYILEVESKNNTGLPLRVCIANPYSKRCDIYTQLNVHKSFGKDYILIPPIFDGGVGYDIHFDNYAVGSFETENSVRSLSLIPIPYHYLRSTPSFSEDIHSKDVRQISLSTIIPGFYYTDLENLKDKETIIFDQSFEHGWWSNAGQHVLVNGWHNGWIISGNQEYKRVFILFVPEFLQLTGIILCVGLLTFLSFSRRRKIFVKWYNFK